MVSANIICMSNIKHVIIVFSSSEWYTNGDYLVILVTVIIILPLSLLKNLGKTSVLFFSFAHHKSGVKDSC